MGRSDFMGYNGLVERLINETYWSGSSGPGSREIHPLICDEAATAITELLDRAVSAEAALEMEKSYDTPLPPFDDDDPDVLYCQKCGSREYLENEDGNRNEYCGQCGQRIDWAAYDAAIEELGGAGVG